MEWFNKFLDRVLPTSYHNHKLTEASTILPMGLDDDPDDPSGRKYRRLTGGRQKDATDLVIIDHYRHVQIARWLVKTKSFANELLATENDFLLGENIMINAKVNKLQKVIDRFWYDSTNNMELTFAEEAQELSLTGELFLPFIVNPEDGFVRLGYMVSEDVQEIYPNPLNQRLDKFVLLRRGTLTVDEQPLFKNKLAVVQYDESPSSLTYGRLMGDIFCFAINRLKNERRGWSNFLQTADWIELHDKLLFNRGIKQEFVNNYHHVLKVNEPSRKGLEARKRLIEREGPPPIGSTRVIGMNESWEIVAPKLNSVDAMGDIDAFKIHAVGGHNQSPEWHGITGGANRATVRFTNPIHFKTLRRRQQRLRYIIRILLDFVIDQAIIHGSLPKTINRSFEVIMPDLNKSDILDFSKAAANFVAGVDQAVSSQLLTKGSAINAMHIFFKNMGLEMDLHDEQQQLSNETKIPNKTSNSRRRIS